jgi:hypothetical protein
MISKSISPQVAFFNLGSLLKAFNIRFKLVNFFSRYTAGALGIRARDDFEGPYAKGAGRVTRQHD